VLLTGLGLGFITLEYNDTRLRTFHNKGLRIKVSALWPLLALGGFEIQVKGSEMNNDPLNPDPCTPIKLKTKN